MSESWWFEPGTREHADHRKALYRAWMTASAASRAARFAYREAVREDLMHRLQAKGLRLDCLVEYKADGRTVRAEYEGLCEIDFDRWDNVRLRDLTARGKPRVDSTYLRAEAFLANLLRVLDKGKGG